MADSLLISCSEKAQSARRWGLTVFAAVIQSVVRRYLLRFLDAAFDEGLLSRD